MVADRPEEPVSIPLVWFGADDVPVLAANQFIVQHHRESSGEFYLTIGHVTPPVFVGTPEEQREQLERLAYVTVRTVGRFQLTRQRLIELIEVLQRNLATYDEQGGVGR